MILYKIHRLLVLIISWPINKLMILLNGVKCGKGFWACGCIFIRNVGYMSFGDNVFLTLTVLQILSVEIPRCYLSVEEEHD